MFDFEKLEVYKKAKTLNNNLTSFIDNVKINKTHQDQLQRAAFSIMLNIAEGSGRFTNPDKRNFYVIARGYALSPIRIIDISGTSEKMIGF